MENMEELTHILLDLLEGRVSLSSREMEVLSGASCRQLGIAQQGLLSTYGLNPETIWRNWNKNRDILPDVTSKLRQQLPDDHIVKRILAEHDMLLCFTADLYNVNAEIQNLSSASSNTIEIRKLANISGHLISMEQHRQREDDLIFPELANRGYEGLSLMIVEQHRQLGDCHHELNHLIWNIEKIELSNFKKVLSEIVGQLVPMMRKHIFVENNIILPLVLDFIEEKEFWYKIKELNDQMGYCGFYS